MDIQEQVVQLREFDNDWTNEIADTLEALNEVYEAAKEWKAAVNVHAEGLISHDSYYANLGRKVDELDSAIDEMGRKLEVRDA